MPFGFLFPPQVTQPIHLKVRAADQSSTPFSGSNGLSELCFLIPAQKGVVFFPRNTRLTLKFSGKVEMHEFENSVGYSLTNSNTGEVVSEKTWTTERSGMTIDENIDVSLNSRNSYELKMSAKVSCGDSPGAISELQISS